MTAIRPARAADAPRCAAILAEWIAETPWYPAPRPAEEPGWLAPMIARGEVRLAEDGAGAAGFVALDAEGFVTCLYVAARARGRGVGRALLADAKARAGRLRLWTHQANRGARAFYAREGLVEARRSEGDNADGLPDVELVWPPGEAAR